MLIILANEIPPVDHNRSRSYPSWMLKIDCSHTPSVVPQPSNRGELDAVIRLRATLMHFPLSPTTTINETESCRLMTEEAENPVVAVGPKVFRQWYFWLTYIDASALKINSNVISNCFSCFLVWMVMITIRVSLRLITASDSFSNKKPNRMLKKLWSHLCSTDV